MADTSPSLRSTSAECLAASAAGAASGEPVHGGSAASTATARDGWASAQLIATAAPMDTPPTAIAPSRAALSSSDTYPSISRSGCGGGVTTTASDLVQGGGERPVDVVVVGPGARQQNRRHAAQIDRHH